MKKDIILKETLKSIVKSVAYYILKIKVDTIELIETEKERIESKRADIVVKINNEFILHLEIQNNNDYSMPYRMLRYWLDITQTTNLPIKQYLIYIGKDKLRMKNNILKDGVNYVYNLIDMRSIDCEYFLKEDTPDSLVLAVLCDFKDKNPKDVIKYIIDRLQYHLKDDLNGFRKYTMILEEISTNRDLKDIVKEVEMLSEIRLEDLPSWEIGMEKGLEKGLEKGKIDSAIIVVDKFGISVEEVAKQFGIDKNLILERLKKR